MENWTREHFITYIFFCMAYSDEDMDSEELETIKTFVQAIVECKDLSSSIIENVKNEIVSHSKEKKETYIKDNINSFIKTEEGKQKLIQGIEEIIIADLSVETDEMDFYRFLKRLFRA